MASDPTHLSNAELAEWITNELRKQEAREKPKSQPITRALKSDKHTIAGKSLAWANDTQAGPQVRAIIAGQQAISRELPHLTLTGEFSAAPAPEGGWTVRYSVRPADSFGTVPLRVVECVVAANGAAFVRQSPDANVAQSKRK